MELLGGLHIISSERHIIIRVIFQFAGGPGIGDRPEPPGDVGFGDPFSSFMTEDERAWLPIGWD
jgi:hypothetical protein